MTRCTGDRQAPGSGGALVAITSDDLSIASVPDSVLVAQGATAATFTIDTTTILTQTVVGITASFNGVSQTIPLTVQPPANLALLSLTISPVNVAGGSGATGTVTIATSAPSGGADVALLSDNTSVVNIPSHVTVRKGDTTATFAITTFSVTATQSANVSGSYGGLTQHDTLTVIPASAVQLTNLTITPSSVSGGTTATGTVTMSAAAPTGGLLISLASKHRNFASVPSGVTVPGGATTVSFTIAAQAIKSTHTVDIIATYASVTKTAQLTVTKSVASLNIFGRIASLFRHVPLSLSVSTKVTQPLASGLPSRYSLYTPELNLMAETETTTASSPAITYEYVWFGRQPVAQIETASTRVHYDFNDYVGTPLLTTDTTAVVDWRVERDPFGSRYAVRAGPSRYQPIAFPGQEEDANADRSYNIFRWYRGGWGRYTQADPAGIAISQTPYAYADNDPISSFDPLGLMTFTWAWGPGKPKPSFDPAANCNGSATKVACTNLKSVKFNCNCVGCTGAWSPEVTMFVNVDMYIYKGPIAPGMAHDRSIVDFSTAVAHEVNKHLKPAADDVEKWLRSWVTDQPTQSECENECKTIERLGPGYYKGALASTREND